MKKAKKAPPPIRKTAKSKAGSKPGAALTARKAAKSKTRGKPGAPSTLSAAAPAVSPAVVMAAADPFNLESLSLPQDFSVTGVKKALHTLPVRKPQRQEFVRTHPTIRGTVALVEDKTDREEYIVSDPDRKGFVKALSEALPGEVVLKTLYLTVTRQGVWFLWPVKLPGPDGKEMDWTRSSREAAQMAMETWLRVASNRSLGAYDIFTAEKITTEPVWPDISNWQELLRIAFRSRLITSFDHPLIRNLTGE
jgi:hypothetical protein